MMRYMNMQKHISNLGLAFKAKKVIWGEKAVLSNMKEIKLIILASDAGDNITSKIQKKAHFYELTILVSFSSDEIEKAIGKRTLCLGVTDEGFKELLTFSGGLNIC